MDYKRIYDQLVENCKVRGLDKKSVDYYTELHHILPRSLGGDNSKDNLVMLSGREHYIAHMLLWKAYPKEAALKYAAMMMSNRAVCKVNSHVYSALKEDFAKSVSETKRGKRFKDILGQRFSKLLVVEQDDFYEAPSGARTAKWICKCDCGTFISVVIGSLTSKNTQSCGCLVSESGKARSGENNHMFGRKHTEETKEKFKLRPVLRGADNPMFGRPMSEHTKRKLREANLGKPWSEEERANHMKSMRYGEDHHMFGKSHPPELLKQISESLKARDQRPWENTATQTVESMLKWAMCDYYYDLWIYFDKPGLKKFTKIYNELHSDDVSLAFFTNPRLRWLTGWIPNEDPKWLEFRELHLEV